MAPEPAYRRGGGGGDDTHMKLLCSHGGGFFQPSGPGGEPRYVGGVTRVLVVSRDVSFRDLAARLAEMVAGGGGVSASAAEQARAISIRHRLADDEGLEDVLVTVTCDEEVAHMRDEYDRLRARRPAARFRVFVTTAAPSSSGCPKRATAATAGLPPLAPQRPSMRRVQSEQAVAARAQQHQHRPLTWRVHSAHELAGAVYTRMQPSFHHHHRSHQHCGCCCSCQRRDRYTPAPQPPARPAYANAMPYMSKKVAAAPPSPVVSAAAAAGRTAAVCTEAAAVKEKTTSRGVEAAVQNRRAIWELE